MNIVEINSELFDGFICSKTGLKVAFYPEVGTPEYDTASDVVNKTCVRGVLVDEVPELINAAEGDNVALAWDEHWTSIQDADDCTSLDDALRSFDYEGLIALKVETHGMACGPVSMRAYYLVSIDDAVNIELITPNDVPATH